jgi:hypothetical protein
MAKSANKPKKTLKEIQESISGAEPKFDSSSEIDEEILIKTLNWYALNVNDNEREKFIPAYLKKNDYSLDRYKGISASVWNSNPTLAHLCRISVRGAMLGEKHISFLKERLEKILMQNVSVADPTRKVINIQDRINETSDSVIGELEGYFDDFIFGGYKSHGSAKALFMEKNVKSVHANKILSWAKERRKEFSDILSTKETDLLEGYSNFKKSELKKIIAMFDSFITDSMEIISTRNITKKPRKRKVKTPEQLVSKLQYCKEDKVFGFSSVNPEKIVSASQLWVFNIKTRKLGVYTAQDAAGLSIKGSSVLNYSLESSTAKTLRKPLETIPEVLKSGKGFLKTFLKNINAKESRLTGRINRDTILVRII